MSKVDVLSERVTEIGSNLFAQILDIERRLDELEAKKEPECKHTTGWLSRGDLVHGGYCDVPFIYCPSCGEKL